MKKIFLCCSAGMSTSMLVNKMKASAAERGLEADIIAVSLSEFDDTIKEYDVCLLGPQVRFRHQDLASQAAEYGKKVGVVDSLAYGMMKGDQVLDQALELLDS